MESVSEIESPVTSTQEPKPIRFSGKGAEYFRIWIVNLLLTIVTVGLFIPWATVRIAGVQLNAMQLLPASDLQEFVSAEPESIGAVGEEAATAFDFDISL